MALQRRRVSFLVAIVIALSGGLAAWLVAGGASAGSQRQQPPLALFTTMPIYWSEAADLSGLLDDRTRPHWARVLIEEERPLVPLDVLGSDRLSAFRDLLMVQPRVLSAAENVALDDWVRRGGRLLLFADPMLTAHSRFGIGDRRRPQDVVLLSPILSRWGLRLEFDAGQPPGEHEVELLGEAMTVDLPGRFGLTPTAPDAPATCRLLAENLAADCSIGKGRAFVVADAALLDGDAADASRRGEALVRLMTEAFATPAEH